MVVEEEAEHLFIDSAALLLVDGPALLLLHGGADLLQGVGALEGLHDLALLLLHGGALLGAPPATQGLRHQPSDLGRQRRDN